MELKNKIILITGGAGFLGQHFTQALRKAGATVIVTDQSPSTEIQMDVTNKASITSAFKKVIEQHQKIDVVINNAAIDPKFDASVKPNDSLFENYPEEFLKNSLDVNILGSVLVSQEAVKHMLLHGHGNIINVSSIYGIVGPDQRIYPNQTQKPVDYFITKGGTVMLTKYLATTYGSRGIRCNTLTLGGVFHGHTPEFVEQYSSRTPMKRMAKPEDVVGPMIFLASDAASYITGANLVVDGGWTAW